MIPFNLLLSLWVSQANYFHTRRVSVYPVRPEKNSTVTIQTALPHRLLRTPSQPLHFEGILTKSRAGQREGGPSPTLGRFPSSCLPRGWEARDLEFTLLSCLFFPQTGSLLLSSLSERVRGCRLGHKGGLGRNLWACRVIHQTLPCCQLWPLPTQFPFQLLPAPHLLLLRSPVTTRQQRESQALGGQRGHTRDTGKRATSPSPHSLEMCENPTGGSGVEESCFCCGV